MSAGKNRRAELYNSRLLLIYSVLSRAYYIQKWVLMDLTSPRRETSLLNLLENLRFPAFFGLILYLLGNNKVAILTRFL